MQKLYLANVLSSIDVMAREEDEMVKVLVDWERREISRLYKCASGKGSSRRTRSVSPADDTDCIEEEEEETLSSKKKKKTRSWSSFWYGKRK